MQKALMRKRLYTVLDVRETVSADELRRAYKRKAKETHPDLHPGDNNKAEAFKAISTAYDILGDPDKRAAYDRGEIDEDGQPTGWSRPSGRGAAGAGAGVDPFEDILSGMFGGGRRRPGPAKGADMRYRVEVAFEDAVLGARRDMTMADGRTLSVAIPAGIETGRTLRLKSQGRTSMTGGPPGDALLEIVVRDSSIWTRKGADLHVTTQVPLRTALLGGKHDVPTPGGPVTMRIPEGSNSGTVLRLRDKGVRSQPKPGHLYVRLEVMIEDPKDPELKAWARKSGT